MYEDKDLRDIFEEINLFREDIYSIRKDVVFKMEDPLEKLILATNYPELMIETIGKDSIRMIHVSPMHFLELSKNSVIQEIKRKITLNKVISESLHQPYFIIA